MKIRLKILSRTSTVYYHIWFGPSLKVLTGFLLLNFKQSKWKRDQKSPFVWKVWEYLRGKRWAMVCLGERKEWRMGWCRSPPARPSPTWPVSTSSLTSSSCFSQRILWKSFSPGSEDLIYFFISCYNTFNWAVSWD